MNPTPVIAIFDIGKTNKKLLLFDEQYQVVFEKSAHFEESIDEDGEPCENLDSLHDFLFSSFKEVIAKKEFDIKALNFSAYGASFVYVDTSGKPLTPLYSYLKKYPPELQQAFYQKYGGEALFSQTTASPVLGALNSGLQLYRLKYQQPNIFERVKYALHLPQYISYLFSRTAVSDITSIGCHTALWDFQNNSYHSWVAAEQVIEKLAPIKSSGFALETVFENRRLITGVGIHDSSSALIPYLVHFPEPFMLISTGTWCISLNPFNSEPLTETELQSDCLCYLSYQGKPVKASRLFAGHEHDEQVKRIAGRFNRHPDYYKVMAFDASILSNSERNSLPFYQTDLSAFSSDTEAYHQLMLDIVGRQYLSSRMVLNDDSVKRVFVDGGFSNNTIYISMLSSFFPEMGIFSASMTQATSLGAALAIHRYWNSLPVAANLMTCKQFISPSRR